MSDSNNNNYALFTGDIKKNTKDYTININLNGDSDVIKKINSIEENLQSLLTPSLGELLSAFSVVIDSSALMLSLYDCHKKVDTSFDQMVKGLTKDVGEIQDVFRKLGKYVGEGVVDGLKGSLRDISKATESLGKEISYTFSSTLVIKSPSRVMKKLASYIPDGVIEGIREGMQDVKKSMSKLTDAVLHHRILSQGFI